uniref:Uncharacterized protein n=1 Tax=Populus trichocarpa TaxID=3694 RepID=A0A2K1XMU8_POPTR
MQSCTDNSILRAANMWCCQSSCNSYIGGNTISVSSYKAPCGVQKMSCYQFIASAHTCPSKDGCVLQSEFHRFSMKTK